MENILNIENQMRPLVAVKIEIRINKGFFNFKDSERPLLILNIIIFKYAAEGQLIVTLGAKTFHTSRTDAFRCT